MREEVSMREDMEYGCRCRGPSGFASAGVVDHYPPDLRIEPVHLEIRYTFDLDAQTVVGSVTHTVRARGGAPTRLVLHAVDFADVRCEGAEPLSYRYDGREIRIDWHTPFAADEERQVTVHVELRSPSTGLFFSKPTELFPERAWYAATDNETERARHWLPTIDLPSVRPTLDFHLCAASHFTILANGALQSDVENDDGTRTRHWRLEQPCPSYLTCIAIGDFVAYEDEAFGAIPVAAYTSQKFQPADLARSFGRTREMLAWLQEKLAYPFPYPKYFQFGLPGFGGAMENISLVSWDDKFVLDETLEKEWGWLVDQINIHEMAHSYFGDLIVCRDFAHAWLKESWATYTETLWLEHARGTDECDYSFYSNIERYADEADTRYMRPIVTRAFDHSWHMYDGHLYPGGASRLHMLRKELGDEVFFAGVRLYVQRFAFKTVETDDFRRTLEEVSGRSLGRWFDQWIHGKGYPKLKVTFAYDKKKAQGSFTVEQTQENAEAGVPVFDMPLDLGWTVGTETVLRTVQLERAKHVFVFPLADEPTQVRVDPNNRTVMRLSFDPGEDKLRAQLHGAPDVVGRIRAAQTLLEGGRRSRVETVLAAYRAEPFWGVRVRMAQALAKTGSQAAVEALAELIGEEQEGLVLEHLLRAAGSLRAPEIRAALAARLDAGIALYRARGAAFEALGAQREAAPVERLVEASEQAQDPYGFGQSSAFLALAQTRAANAVAVLRAATEPGACSNRARPAAAAALGGAGAWLEAHQRPAVREALEDLLRDPVDRVRSAAMAGLRALGEAAAIPALLAYRQRLSDQEQADVDRAVAALRAAVSPPAKAKDEALDELRTQLRTLAEAVDKLQAQAKAEEHEG
jgi:aminopeptidase N